MKRLCVIENLTSFNYKVIVDRLYLFAILSLLLWRWQLIASGHRLGPRHCGNHFELTTYDCSKTGCATVFLRVTLG